MTIAVSRFGFQRVLVTERWHAARPSTTMHYFHERTARETRDERQDVSTRRRLAVSEGWRARNSWALSALIATTGRKRSPRGLIGTSAGVRDRRGNRPLRPRRRKSCLRSPYLRFFGVVPLFNLASSKRLSKSCRIFFYDRDHETELIKRFLSIIRTV